MLLKMKIILLFILGCLAGYIVELGAVVPIYASIALGICTGLVFISIEKELKKYG